MNGNLTQLDTAVIFSTPKFSVVADKKCFNSDVFTRSNYAGDWLWMICYSQKKGPFYSVQAPNKGQASFRESSYPPYSSAILIYVQSWENQWGKIMGEENKFYFYG